MRAQRRKGGTQQNAGINVSGLLPVRRHPIYSLPILRLANIYLSFFSRGNFEFSLSIFVVNLLSTISQNSVENEIIRKSYATLNIECNIEAAGNTTQLIVWHFSSQNLIPEIVKFKIQFRFGAHTATVRYVLLQRLYTEKHQQPMEFIVLEVGKKNRTYVRGSNSNRIFVFKIDWAECVQLSKRKYTSKLLRAFPQSSWKQRAISAKKKTFFESAMRNQTKYKIFSMKFGEKIPPFNAFALKEFFPRLKLVLFNWK